MMVAESASRFHLAGECWLTRQSIDQYSSRRYALEMLTRRLAEGASEGGCTDASEGVAGLIDARRAVVTGRGGAHL